MIRALYGGTFDPIHAGHVAVAGTLLATFIEDGEYHFDDYSVSILYSEVDA